MIEWSSTMIIYIMKYTHVNGRLMTIMFLFEWRMMKHVEHGLLKMNGFYVFPAPKQNKNRAGFQPRTSSSTERHAGVDHLSRIAQADAHDVWTFHDLRFYTQKPCRCHF